MERKVKLSEVCSIDRTIIEPDTEQARQLPYLGLENIESGSGEIDFVHHVVDELEGISTTFYFDSNHVLYGKLRPNLNKVALPNFEGRCTTEIIPIKPKDLIDREYLALTLRSDFVVKHAIRFQTGSRMPRADLGRLLSLEIFLPPINVQRDLVSQVMERLNAATDACARLRSQYRDSLLLPSASLCEFFQKSIPIFVGKPSVVPLGWSAKSLVSCARLESGHTPSRRHPEWWGGDVPWLALPDIRKLHGKHAYETTEYTNDAGLANSSARLLPPGTICLCRDASVGFVTILGKPMATSQHFANWICDPEKLDPEFLMYAFMASHEYLRHLSSGAVIKTIYMPTVKSFQICAPDITEQRRIARSLRERLAAAEQLTASLQTRLAEIERLPQRLLAAAFAGNH